MQLTGKKLRIGWFSFSCCEDSTIMMTELMNDHYETWRKVLDIRHAKVLQSKNWLDEMDVAFVEGAIAAPDQEAKLKRIREKAKKLVAIGACANTGMPSAHRNNFTEEQNQEIAFLLQKFRFGKKVKKLDEVVTVDERVNGCPMVEKVFLETLDRLLREFDIVRD